MTTPTDLTIPLSALKFTSAESAEAVADNWDTIQIGVLLQHVVTEMATGTLAAGTLHTVSVTFDVSSEAATGREVSFKGRIDRKTRTLIFASGLATQGDQVLLKATIIYRIA